jgi:hypothetical protein
MYIKGKCQSCNAVITVNLESKENPIECNACHTKLDVETIEKLKDSKHISKCPFCGFSDFWRDKNFPKKVGLVLVIIAAILVPFTYGVSFLVLFVFDLILWKFLPIRVNCYRCQAVFVGFRMLRNSPFLI